MMIQSQSVGCFKLLKLCIPLPHPFCTIGMTKGVLNRDSKSSVVPKAEKEKQIYKSGAFIMFVRNGYI